MRFNTMHIDILGAESLGVRGLCCVVKTQTRKIVIDPGLALGYQRNGLPPHPAQVAVGERVRWRIIQALEDATDVVMSHFHGDHVPLPDANPYQLQAQRVAPLCRVTRLWAKGMEGLSPRMVQRRAALGQILGREIPNAEGQDNGMLGFSLPMPHGRPHSRLGTVMMTRVQSENAIFVHASDIQLLDKRAVSRLLEWRPDIALVGGPPLYLSKLTPEQRGEAWQNAKRLACHVEKLILDHHLLRCEEGLSWLNRLSSETGHPVVCAADFMGQRRCLLEARRAQLYDEMPVPSGWHEAYARGETNTERYQKYRKECARDS
jgi:predicted metallo-beta-lactamase superfamily hydrolase